MSSPPPSASSSQPADTLATGTVFPTVPSSPASVSAPATDTASLSPTSTEATPTSSALEQTDTPHATSTSTTTSSSGPTSTPTSSSSTTPSPTRVSTPPTTTTPTPTPTPTPTSTPSSSQQLTQTTITTSVTVYVNGSPSISETAFPSTIPESSALSSFNRRSAIIGGSAAGGAALLILLLSLAFCARRKRFKQLAFLDRLTRKRKQARSRAMLLDGDDLDDLDVTRQRPGYTDPWDPRLPTRWSETGSMFREEDVWPPPNEGSRLMGPLAVRNDPTLDLGRIVDDVMGPPPVGVHFSDHSASSTYRGSLADSEGAVRSRTESNASNAALLEAAGLAGPVRSSPLAQQGGDAS